MFDPKKLIDQFLGAGGGQKAQDMLGGVLNQLGQAAGQAQQKTSEVAGDLSRQSPGALAQKARDYASTNAGSLAAGALAGGLLTLVLGTKAGRSLGGSAVKLGGLAAIGGLAYKAFQDYKAGRPPLGIDLSGGKAAPASAGPDLLPAPADTPFGGDAAALLVLKAMISAAKADGHIDETERGRILGEFSGAGLEQDARAFLERELASPLDIDALAADATTPELATQVYAASLVAIDPDTDAEKAYLDALAAKLKIDTTLKAHLEGSVAQAKLA